MKKILFYFVINFLLFSSLSIASEHVICSSDLEVPVYDNDLSTVIFKAKNYEDVLLFQSFKSTPLKIKESEVKAAYYTFFNFGFYQPSEIKVVSYLGTETSYVRLQFPYRLYYAKSTGWVNKKFVKNLSDCLGTSKTLQPALDLTISPDSLVIKIEKSPSNFLNGNNESEYLENCCLFPLKKKPTASYLQGMQKFGSSRDNGTRIHAASDLYQSQYQPVYAVADGEILVDRAPFYLGTSATEIRHKGGFIVRYGEIASSSLKPLKLGKTVKAGQLIGYIKKVNSRSVTSAMLHFELYKGTASGPLTTSKGKFQRRSDLLNPTSYLQKWESKFP